MKVVNRFFLALTFVLMLFPIGFVNAQPRSTDLFVAPGASDSGPCTRAEPCDFRYAIETVAKDGDVVYARSGIYTSLDPTEVHLLHIYKSVSLFGSCSFDATTDVTCQTDKMDSILNGEGDRRVITAYGLGVEQIHIEGFAIENGIGAAAPSSAGFGSFDGYGGGVYAKDLQSLTLKNINIHHNYAGKTSGAGGGIYTEKINYLSITNSIMTRNFATLTGIGLGGGLALYDVGHQNPVIIKNNLIDGNETSGNQDSPGAGLFIVESNGVQIVDNYFQNNNIENQRVVDGSSVFISGSYNFLVEHNKFKKDWGDSVVRISSGNAATQGSLVRNSWWQNTVQKNLEITGDLEVSVKNNFFGFQAVSSPLGSVNIRIAGDCIGPSIPYVYILFNTFAAADYGLDVYECSSILVDDNIFTEIYTNALQLNLSYGPIQRSIIKNIFYDYAASDETGTIPIFEDPKLANISTGDFHLTHGSAAIDRERPPGCEIDIDGDPRPVGSGYDLGADEYSKKYYMPMMMK